MFPQFYPEAYEEVKAALLLRYQAHHQSASSPTKQPLQAAATPSSSSPMGKASSISNMKKKPMQDWTKLRSWISSSRKPADDAMEDVTRLKLSVTMTNLTLSLFKRRQEATQPPFCVLSLSGGLVHFVGGDFHTVFTGYC